MVINTLNESSLHKTLKEIYALQDGSKTEAEEDGVVYDILNEDGSVIEIQTKNLSKLLAKSLEAIKRRKITIVHPIIVSKTIETYDKDGKLILRRKSPKKENIYSVFRELTGLYPVLLEENFTLELLEIEMTETRIRTEEKTQSKNKRRRFEKDWIKTGKKLDQILSKTVLKTREDYLSLLPSGLNETFTRKEISEKLKQQKKAPASSYQNISLMTWVFEKMGLLEITGKNGNAIVYKLATK